MADPVLTPPGPSAIRVNLYSQARDCSQDLKCTHTHTHTHTRHTHAESHHRAPRCSEEVAAVQLLSDSVTPWTVACPAPLSMEFHRQEYWSEVPFPPRGALPNPGTEPASPAPAGRFFITGPPGQPRYRDRNGVTSACDHPREPRRPFPFASRKASSVSGTCGF